MGVSARDLNDWADALGVDNDDDAQLAVVRLMKRAQMANDAARLLTRMLGDLPGGVHAKNATRYTEDVLNSLTYVAIGFDRHERGMH